jgi:hypothetical protein
MDACEYLGSCGFFKKYQTTRELACIGFIKQFCQGTLQNECKRKVYRQEHGVPPDPDMMPNGGMIRSQK